MQESSRQKLETRLARVEQQIRAFKELHSSELQLILDEIASIRVELASFAPAPDADAPPGPPSGTPADPAANSPRRNARRAERSCRRSRLSGGAVRDWASGIMHP